MFGAEYFVPVGAYVNGLGVYCLECVEEEYVDKHHGQKPKDEDTLVEWLRRDEDYSVIMEASTVEFNDGLWCEGCGKLIFEAMCANCGDDLGEGSGEASKVGAKALGVYLCDSLCGNCMKLQREAETKHATAKAQEGKLEA